MRYAVYAIPNKYDRGVSAPGALLSIEYTSSVSMKAAVIAPKLTRFSRSVLELPLSFNKSTCMHANCMHSTVF